MSPLLLLVFPLTGFDADRQRVFKKLIYPKAVKNMQNLPQSFLETGVVEIRDGMPVE